jgi:very-short-patch-repair endonuclease
LEKIIERINNKCLERGYEFRGFVDTFTTIIDTRIIVVCSKCENEWTPTLNNFLNNNKGCPKCNGGVRSNTEEFIKKARLKHGDKYDYSKVNYVNNLTPVEIICPIHREFNQLPKTHLRGHGCSKCSKKHKHTTEEWIEIVRKIWNNRYDYSMVKYINAKMPVSIVCPQHGVFERTPDDHRNGCGCPYCKESHLERDVYRYLTEYNIKFEIQKRFEWLGRKRLDFYLPDYNVAIECQGKQHFEAIEFFGGEEKLKYVQNNDEIKKQLCQENGVKLLYIRYDDSVNDILSCFFEKKSISL